MNDGFLYSEYSHRGYNSYLKCIEKKCPVRAKVCEGFFIVTNAEKHNHANNHGVVAEVSKAYERLKLLARESSRPLLELHSEMLESVRLA